MSEITLKFANEDQYQEFINRVKEDVLNEMKPKGAFHPTWEHVRGQLEHRFGFDSNYNNNCGHHYNNQQSMYAVFRLAFQQPTIKDLRNVEGERIQSLHDELFELIDKYRRGNE